MFFYFSIFILIILIAISIKCIANIEKKQYSKIDFTNKKNYLCALLVLSNSDLKTNKAVISRNNDIFLVETENKKGEIQSLEFNKKDINDIEIKNKLGTSFKTRYDSYNVDYNKSYFSGRVQGEFDTYKTIKYSKIYEIKIKLKSGVYVILESKKNPSFLFDCH